MNHALTLDILRARDPLHCEKSRDLRDPSYTVDYQICIYFLNLLLFLKHFPKMLRVDSKLVNSLHFTISNINDEK